MKSLTEQIIEEIVEFFKKNTDWKMGINPNDIKKFIQQKLNTIIQENKNNVLETIKDEKEKYEPAYESEDQAIVKFADDLLEKLK